MRRLRKLLVVLAILAVVAGVAVFAVFQMPQFGGKFEGARLQRMMRSPQFIGGRFENTPRASTTDALIGTIRLYSQGQVREPRFEVPVMAIDPAPCDNLRRRVCVRAGSGTPPFSWRSAASGC